MKGSRTTLRCSVGAANMMIWLLYGENDAVASLPSWITFTGCLDTRLVLITRSNYKKLGFTISQSPLAVADWILQRISTIQIACWISVYLMQAGRCKISWNEASPLNHSSCSHIHACNPERNHKLGRSTCDMFLPTAPWFWFHSARLLLGETKVSFQEELATAWSSAAGFSKKQVVVVPQLRLEHNGTTIIMIASQNFIWTLGRSQIIYRYRNDLEWLRRVAGGSKRIDSEVLVPWLQPGAGLQWESEWSEAQKSWSWQSWIQVLSTCTNSMCNKERCS